MATLAGVGVKVGHGVRVGRAVGSAESSETLPLSRSVRPHPILTSAKASKIPSMTLAVLCSTIILSLHSQLYDT